MVDHITNSASVHIDDVEILVLDEVSSPRVWRGIGGGGDAMVLVSGAVLWCRLV